MTNLSSDQERLLVTLVEVWRSLPASQRSRFLIPPYDGRGSTYLIMLPNPSRFHLNAYAGDIDTFVEAGFLRPAYGRHGLKSIDLTNEAFDAYKAIKSREAGPIERREAYVHRYLDDETVRREYPAALAKLDEADSRLWSDFSDTSLTTIGHLCREAMQLFADSLVKKAEVSEVERDLARTKNRIRAVIDSVNGRLGTREFALLLASVEYWSAVNDFVQRQEHGSQVAERPLGWEDARRVVFHTALVILEIAKSVERLSDDNSSHV